MKLFEISFSISKIDGRGKVSVSSRVAGLKDCVKWALFFLCLGDSKSWSGAGMMCPRFVGKIIPLRYWICFLCLRSLSLISLSIFLVRFP